MLTLLVFFNQKKTQILQYRWLSATYPTGCRLFELLYHDSWPTDFRFFKYNNLHALQIMPSLADDILTLVVLGSVILACVILACVVSACVVLDYVGVPIFCHNRYFCQKKNTE